MITIPDFNSNKIGRLGNKLFVLATALSLAKDNNDKVILEMGEFSEMFENVQKVDKEPDPMNIYAEARYEYDKIPYMENLALSGYFQSYKYFFHNLDHVNFMMSPKFRILARTLNNVKKYKTGNKVAIHVRRGDYLNTTGYHTHLGMDYYSEAMKQFPDDKFVVFSDDIEWCRQNFKGAKFSFVDKGEDNPERDMSDIYLMKSCKACIIANSSFSWWGALTEKEKRVIYPINWFGEKYKDKSIDDLIPDNWEGI